MIATECTRIRSNQNCATLLGRSISQLSLPLQVTVIENIDKPWQNMERYENIRKILSNPTGVFAPLKLQSFPTNKQDSTVPSVPVTGPYRTMPWKVERRTRAGGESAGHFDCFLAAVLFFDDFR